MSRAKGGLPFSRRSPREILQWAFLLLDWDPRWVFLRTRRRRRRTLRLVVRRILLAHRQDLLRGHHPGLLLAHR